MALSKMLLPVAVEPRDARVLAYACGLLEQGVHQLLVAHVVDSSGQEAPVIMAEVERARDRLRLMVEPYLGCGMDIEVRVATGSVYREIMALANQVNVDVILCGTEGKSFVDYLFSGSVSEDIALRGDQRTMTVRYDLLGSEEHAGSLGRSFAQRLVIPTDFSSSSLRAVLSAFERPSQALGTLHVLHVLAEGESPGDAEAQMRALRALADEHDADCVTEIREAGSVDVAVLDYLTDIDATGVITGRRGQTQLERGLLGSVSMKLLQEAPCPVVIQP
ncbi:MAG TPA: universal stress protein [Coriobacteriia bacterium]|nr:universal stress protein [Coriobacteriia bacterium]